MDEGRSAHAAGAASIIVSADDLGLSRGITDGILDAVDNGCVTSTSIVANGTAFEYAIEQYLVRPGLGLTVHLNLMEGRPLSRADGVDLLVDRKGRFCRSFPSLLLGYARAGDELRRRMHDQVKVEMRAQILRVSRRLGQETGLRVDGHQHYHMIPFVFDALMELNEEFRFSYVRLLDEPFFLLDGRALSVRNHLGPNLLKHLLLKALAARARRILRARDIAHCHRFVGLLFSGNMTERSVRSALGRIRRRDRDELVELLLHPGQAAAGEEDLWAGRPELAAYYYSAQRERERDTLKSAGFRSTVGFDDPAR